MTATPEHSSKGDDRASDEANASLDRVKRRDKIAVETFRLMHRYGISNGDDLAVALTRMHEDGRRQGASEMREAAGYLHEQINPASDEERQNSDPGAGAMGAVIEYRDKIRALPLPGDAPAPAEGETT